MENVLESFEAWAQVSTRLRGQPESAQAALLATLGLSELWPRAEAHWRAVLMKDALAGQLGRAQRYLALCQAADLASGTSRAGVAAAAAGQVPRPYPGQEATFDISARGPVPESQPSYRLAEPKVREPSEAKPRAPTSSAQGERFVDGLAPAAASPAAPDRGQNRTAGVNLAVEGGAVAAMRKACAWPVAQYAEVCATVEREPHKQHLIWARHGVVGEHVPEVMRTWAKRFRADPGLEAQWRALVDAARARTRRGGG